MRITQGPVVQPAAASTTAPADAPVAATVVAKPLDGFAARASAAPAPVVLTPAALTPAAYGNLDLGAAAPTTVAEPHARLTLDQPVTLHSDDQIGAGSTWSADFSIPLSAIATAPMSQAQFLAALGNPRLPAMYNRGSGELPLQMQVTGKGADARLQFHAANVEPGMFTQLPIYLLLSNAGQEVQVEAKVKQVARDENAFTRRQLVDTIPARAQMVDSWKAELGPAQARAADPSRDSRVAADATQLATYRGQATAAADTVAAQRAPLEKAWQTASLTDRATAVQWALGFGTDASQALMAGSNAAAAARNRATDAQHLVDAMHTSGVDGAPLDEATGALAAAQAASTTADQALSAQVAGLEQSLGQAGQRDELLAKFELVATPSLGTSPFAESLVHLKVANEMAGSLQSQLDQDTARVKSTAPGYVTAIQGRIAAAQADLETARKQLADFDAKPPTPTVFDLPG